MKKIFYIPVLAVLTSCAAHSVTSVQRDACIDTVRLNETLTKKLTEHFDKNRLALRLTVPKQQACTGAVVSLVKPLRTLMTSADIYEQHRDSVLMVGFLFKCSRCSSWHSMAAAGFVISTNGVMVTNYHVLMNTNAAVMAVMTIDGKLYPIKKVLGASETKDIAIVQLEGDGFEPLALSTDAPVGSDVTVIGHPGSQYYMCTRGIVSCYYFMYDKKKRRIPTMAVTADFGNGASGGPVFNDYGNVVGMVVSTRAVTSGSDPQHGDTQMVVKNCVPAESILELINPKEKL